MQKTVLASLVLMVASGSALAGEKPSGKNTAGTRDVYSACVYQDEEGIYGPLCDETSLNSFHNRRAVDENGCTDDQVLIKSYSPIKMCPVPMML